MLVDSRQQVQDYAYSLLTELNALELTHGSEKKTLEIEKEDSYSLGNEPIDQIDLELDTNLPVLLKPGRQNRDSSCSRSILRQNGTDWLENQSSRLNQQVLDPHTDIFPCLQFFHLSPL